MSKYRVEIRRDYYAFGSIEVEAENEETAESQALEHTDEIGFSIKGYTGDDEVISCIRVSEREVPAGEKYVAVGGTCCPYCGSCDIAGLSSLSAEGGGASQRIGCNSCEKTWYNSYTLTGLIEEE